MNNYIEATRGSITSSKGKAFDKNEYYFYLVYIKEVVIPGVKEDHFMFGDAFHYLMEHGEEGFLKKYRIEDGLIKKQLVTAILDRYREEGMDEADVAAHAKRLKKSEVTLPALRQEWYGPDQRADICTKMPLTAAEGRDVMGIYAIIKNQPNWDLGCTGYIREHTWVAYYKTLKISFKPDRVKFWDKNGKYYTLEEMDELFLNKDKEERKALIQELGMQGLIRDFKTTANIYKLKQDLIMSYSNDNEGYGYIYSMAYYYSIIYALYGIQCEVWFDFVEKTAPYATQIVSLPLAKLQEKMQKKILPVWERIIEAEKTGEYALPTIDEILADKDMKKYFWHFPNAQSQEVEYLDFDTI